MNKTEGSITVNQVEVSAEKRKQISSNTFDEVVTFYNDNHQAFLEFEEEFGINIWYLNHFRTYFSYRNLMLKKAGGGKDNHSTKKQVPVGKKIYRALVELLLMLVNYRPVLTNQNGHVIVSNAGDIKHGKNTRFEGLAFDEIYNRPLLDVKTKNSPKAFSTSAINSTDNMFISYLLRFSFLSDLSSFHRSLKKLRQTVSKTPSTLRKESYQSINRIFWKDLPFYYLSYLRYLSIYRFFKRSKIKSILLSDENSPQQKMIQYAAQQNNIKVFAFQHGNIHILHPAYVYGNYKVKPILPDVTFTWGSYFTDFLIEYGGYKPHQLKTVGRLLPEREVKQHPQIDKSRPIMVYASQPIRDEKVRHKLLKDVLWAAKQLYPEYQLIIRPHPRETENEFFERASNEVDFQDYILDRESDLHAHFEVCSLLIVAFSTVGTEFISYYKPMIVLDYLHQDLIDWVREGVGIPVRSKEELFECIQNDNLQIDKEKYKAFINKYYKTGPSVREEVLNTILDENDGL